ncbi:MAG: DUF4837 family protein [Rikenellaceae bacterium]
MTKLSTILLSVAAVLGAVSCDAFHTVSSNSVTSQGAPYELIVVANQPQWEGELGDSLRAVLTAPIPYLQQTEPFFDVLRVTNQGYNNLVTKHRNILVNNIDPTLKETSASVQYNIYATPQVIVTISGATEQDITKYLSDNRAEIVEVLERAERDRAIDYASKFDIKSLSSLIESKFGFEMKIPAGYTLRNEEDNFLWLSYEYPTASQGIIIYKYPAVDGMKSLTAENLTAARNRFTALVPGPSDGSYMTTFMDYTPDYRTFRLDGRLWAEMHGLWEVDGDFMGGPFVSYSTLDTTTGEVVTIDCYVFSPKLPKRNFVRGVEHLIYNVKFPDLKK